MWVSGFNDKMPYMQVSVVVKFHSIFEPNDVGSGFSCGHTDENYFVTQNILIIKMGRLGYSGTLKQKFKIVLLHKLNSTVLNYCYGKHP
jgi:hypothetical protein